MTFRIFRALLPVAAPALLALGSGSPAEGQERVALSPVFASFYAVSPLRDVGEADWERQRAAPAVGVRLTVRPWPSFGFELAGSYAFSSLIVTEEDASQPADLSLQGHVLEGGARVLYYPRRSNLRIIAGAAVVRRGGEIWDLDGLDELTDVAGVAGFAIRAAVNRSINLDIGVEAHLYVADPDGPERTRYEESFQQDLRVVVGIPLTLAR